MFLRICQKVWIQRIVQEVYRLFWGFEGPTAIRDQLWKMVFMLLDKVLVAHTAVIKIYRWMLENNCVFCFLVWVFAFAPQWDSWSTEELNNPLGNIRNILYRTNITYYISSWYGHKQSSDISEVQLTHHHPLKVLILRRLGVKQWRYTVASVDTWQEIFQCDLMWSHVISCDLGDGVRTAHHILRVI